MKQTLVFIQLFISIILLTYVEQARSDAPPSYMEDVSKTFLEQKTDKLWSAEQYNKIKNHFNQISPQELGAYLQKIECRMSACRLVFANFDQKAKRLELTKIDEYIFSMSLPEKSYTQGEAYGEHPNLRVVYLVDADRF